jgi:hypothetical protein
VAGVPHDAPVSPWFLWGNYYLVLEHRVDHTPLYGLTPNCNFGDTN